MERSERLYTFFFVGANGLGYSKEIYWENLYAFKLGQRPLLAAVRAVPRHEMLFSTYLALRRQNHPPIHQKVFPHGGASVEAVSLVESVTELIPPRPSTLPVELQQKLDEVLPGAVDQLAVDYNLENTLGQSPAVAVEEQGFVDRFSTPTGAVETLADLEGEDLGWVHLGNVAQQILQERIAELQASVNSRSATELTTKEDLVRQLGYQLYSHPTVLGLVQRIIRAKGGFVSPIVRHFIGFYYRCLQERAQELAASGHGVPFWQEQLEGEIARAAAASAGFLPYYAITILGRIEQGAAVEDGADPDRTKKGYQVDPDINLADLRLAEISARIERSYLRRAVRQYFRHNIDRVDFLETQPPEKS